MRGENKDDVVMKRLEEEIKNMSLEKRKLISEVIERCKNLDVDELRR